MWEWKSGTVAANGLHIHYTRTGGDKPPLVLAHGVTDDGLCWSPLAAALAAEYDLIMVDARGHGRSEASEDGYGPREQAEDLAGVIQALGLRKPAILGHSMGAATALVLAGTYPDLPGAILLEDPPAWWTAWYETRDGDERRATMKANALAYKTASREVLIAGARERHAGWSDAELAPWADAKLRFSPTVLSVFDAANPIRIDWSATLRRITCPALLITGDPSRGAIVTEETAALLKELVPQLEIAHVPGTGHNIRRENFDQFLEVVRALLAEHRAAIG